MHTQELREEVKKYIEQADEVFLKMVHAMSSEYKKTDMVGYNVDGTPISKKELVSRAKEASARVKSGDYLTQEEIEKEKKNW